ncbi:hypothetical protein JKY79_01045 [Candidatus Babeliales bacterium]|nr:hypothetical protein [Candidatus Babeliales bacterium]
MRLEFQKLKDMGFDVRQDEDGVEIVPQGMDDMLPRKIAKHLQQLDFSPIEQEIVIEAAMTAQIRILISKAIS